MAKAVIWSRSATADLNEILAYWAQRNKSKVYPNKLNRLIRSAVERLSKGEIFMHLTSMKGYAYIYVREYRIYFESWDDRILILRIWDGRRDPGKEPY